MHSARWLVGSPDAVVLLLQVSNNCAQLHLASASDSSAAQNRLKMLAHRVLLFTDVHTAKPGLAPLLSRLGIPVPRRHECRINLGAIQGCLQQTGTPAHQSTVRTRQQLSGQSIAMLRTSIMHGTNITCTGDKFTVHRSGSPNMTWHSTIWQTCAARASQLPPGAAAPPAAAAHVIRPCISQVHCSRWRRLVPSAAPLTREFAPQARTTVVQSSQRCLQTGTRRWRSLSTCIEACHNYSYRLRVQHVAVAAISHKQQATC